MPASKKNSPPLSYVPVTEQKRLNDAREQVSRGKSGDHISASDSGARFVKIIARTAMPGTTFATTRPGPAPTDGEKMVWLGSPTTNSGSALRLLCGTAEIRS